MAVVFDPAKDARNLAKHGVSLTRSADLLVFARALDPRHAERRVRAYGLLDGDVYCLTYTRRGRDLRAISLRRTHLKEYARAVENDA